MNVLLYEIGSIKFRFVFDDFLRLVRMLSYFGYDDEVEDDDDYYYVINFRMVNEFCYIERRMSLLGSVCEKLKFLVGGFGDVFGSIGRIFG